MPEHTDRAPDPSSTALPQALAPFIAIIGAALVDIGLGEPSDALLLPTARTLYTLAPHTSASHAKPG